MITAEHKAMSGRQKHRTRKYIVSQPPRGWSLPSEKWHSLSAVQRAIIARRFYEMDSGIAMQKDSLCGRGKKEWGGFYGLHAGEYELARLATERRTDQDLLVAVDQLRHELNADEQRLAMFDELISAFEPQAARHGMDLPQYIAAFVDIEKQMRQAGQAWHTARDAGPLLQLFIEVIDFAGGDGLATTHAALQQFAETRH